MRKFERFAVRHPIIFGFVMILLYSILSTLTWPITQLYLYPEGNELGTALAKLVIGACFLLLIWGFGWLKLAGYTTCGRKRIWLLVLGLLIYNAILGVYAMTGTFRGELPPLSLALAILVYSFATSLLEETMYRGLVLTAMVQAWGNSRRGLFMAAFLSGLFFASLHFVNLIIRPFPVVAMQVLSMTMVGFMYAAIALYGSSIWPVIVFHGAINSIFGWQVSQSPIFAETTTGWVLFALVLLPLAGVGSILLRKIAINAASFEAENHYDRQLETVKL